MANTTSRTQVRSGTYFRPVPATELQDLDIWRIVACLPSATFEEVKRKILSLSRDRSFALNYWVKVCKLRATRGEPMPWDGLR